MFIKGPQLHTPPFCQLPTARQFLHSPAEFTGVSAPRRLTPYRRAHNTAAAGLAWPERVRIGVFQQHWRACRIFSLILTRFFGNCSTELGCSLCYQRGHFQLFCQPTRVVVVCVFAAFDRITEMRESDRSMRRCARFEAMKNQRSRRRVFQGGAMTRQRELALLQRHKLIWQP